MAARALILTSRRDYAQTMRQALAKLGAARIDVEMDGLRAMQLTPQTYDLIVIDRMLNAMDGLQLLLLWRPQAPAGKFVVVSDNAHEEEKAEAHRCGADMFLKRPTDDAAWAAAIEAIEAQVHASPKAIDLGLTEPLQPIADVVQMNCLSGNSVVLQVATEQQRGDIFIHGGEVFHAQFPGRSGVEAFHDMLQWEDGSAQIQTLPLHHLPPRTIEIPHAELLYSLMRVEPLPGGDRTPLSGRLAQLAGETTASDISDEAPPRDTSPTRTQALAALRGEKGEQLPVQTHWKVDLVGTLVEGSGVNDPEHCALITNFIFRKLADIAVALEVEYFDQLTLWGPEHQQVLVADNWGVRHALLEGNAPECSRANYVNWCREQGL